ncbi:MAG TPA: ABC transporter permease subunit [Thermoanaerobaculia bacterium]|nr:ABC transporter permease subunit [Thermoanaerobaculia bacterium]
MFPFIVLVTLLRWGGDSEGGAPYVEADPSNPAIVRGFDVEVAGEIAKGLGRNAQFVQVQFQEIDQSVARGDFDIGMSGVEQTAPRCASLACTMPYFEFQEVLSVRPEDTGRYHTLRDLRGHRVATLAGTIAYDRLLQAEKEDGVVPVSYDDDVHPYEDLKQGRVDAVLLDNIIAVRALHRTGGLAIQPTPIATGHYVGVLAKENGALRDQINEVLKARMRDGTLERIYRKWNIWDEYQPKFFASVNSVAPATPPANNAAEVGGATLWQITLRYVPALLRASVITILLSCLAMALAIGFGVMIASGRVYGNVIVRGILTLYVEVVRGTPVLLQLFVLYYGLSSVIKLPAFVAALLGLGLNYAAYESEIYRGALEAVQRGQLEAARTLGLTEYQVFTLVRGPQAFRIALAPMTNDFVALLKDSSLVSVITVIELTKQTSIFAANIGSWVIPGALCAGLYLLLSLPLARLAGYLESKWRMSSE